MRYCSKCGAEIMDEAYVCPHCGCKTEQTKANEEEGSMLKTVAKIFMLISCIATAFLLIPLCWTIPMTVIYWKKTASHQHIGTGFKVCSLLFVNTIAGILMLCDKND